MAILEASRRAAGATVSWKLQIGDEFFLSDTGYAAPDQWWDSRIVRIDGVGDAINPDTYAPVSFPVTVVLDNADGALADMFDPAAYSSFEATLTMRVDGFESVQAAGPAEIEMGDAGTVKITIESRLHSTLGILQRSVDAHRYPLAIEQSIGKAVPIMIGNAFGDHGSVEGVIIEENIPAATCSFVVHAGVGKDIKTVWRHWSTIPTLVNPANWNATLNAIDGEGEPYVRVDVTLGHAAGDRYLVNGEGLIGEAYVTLDGANDWLSATVANSPDLPGRADNTGSFTVETKVYFDNITAHKNITGVWGSAANERAWALWFDHGLDKVRFYLSPDGVAQYYARADTTVFAATTDYIIRATYTAGPTPSVAIWINGVPQALTEVGVLPTALHASIADFEIGTYDAGTHKLGGRVYYVMWAPEAQPITVAGATGDREDPLENVKNWWPMHLSGGRDILGTVDLTEVSLADVDYTLDSYEQTPAQVAHKLALWRYYWNEDSEHVNRASFAALGAEQEADGWATANDYAGALMPGGVREPADVPDPILKVLGSSADYCVRLGPDGKLRADSADYSSAASSTVADWHIAYLDIGAAPVQIGRPPQDILNQARVTYHWTDEQHGRGEGLLLASDPTSIDIFGPTEEKTLDLPLVQTVALAKAVAGRYLLRRAGPTKQVEFDVAGLFGLLVNAGETVTFTHPGLPGGWDWREIYVTERRLSYPELLVPTVARERANVYGPITFAGGDAGGGFEDQTYSEEPEADTFVDAGAKGTCFGTVTELRHTQSLLHGNRDRASLRWGLGVIDAAAGTISAATLKLYLTRIRPYGSDATPWIAIRESMRALAGAPEWDETSTWNAWDNDGAWADANTGAVDFSTPQKPSATGELTIAFNAAGIAWLNAQLISNGGTDNKAPITFLNPSGLRGFYFNSREHASADQRPLLTIVWS